VEEDEVLGTKMLFLSKQVNHLMSHVNDNHLDRRTVCWTDIEDVTDFPCLDEEQLRSLTCGSYQLRLSSSYMQEHLDKDSLFQVHKEERGLLRVRIQSRHVSSKSYQLWIRYSEGNVIAWYCKCKAGARVVGTCAHVAGILWYLGYARHRQHSEFGVRNWGDFLLDSSVVDGSDSESSGDDSEAEE
jgi:hypothetical protein